MFDRHQAEITVIQFTGHSLPVHQSMTVHGILPCPISSAKHAYVISSHNCHRNVSLPSGASPWNDMFGRVEGQYTTLPLGDHFECSNYISPSCSTAFSALEKEANTRLSFHTLLFSLEWQHPPNDEFLSVC